MSSCTYATFLVAKVDSLCAALKPHVPELVSFTGRSQPMLAIYPGGSASYPRHVDNSDGNGRILTCILYLNAEWRPGDGGELRLAPAAPAQSGSAFLDVAPLLNRFVMFWSDARMPHEVKPALRQRAACTLWLIDTAAAKLPLLNLHANMSTDSSDSFPLSLPSKFSSEKSCVRSGS